METETEKKIEKLREEMRLASRIYEAQLNRIDRELDEIRRVAHLNFPKEAG